MVGLQQSILTVFHGDHPVAAGLPAMIVFDKKVIVGITEVDLYILYRTGVAKLLHHQFIAGEDLKSFSAGLE